MGICLRILFLFGGGGKEVDRKLKEDPAGSKGLLEGLAVTRRGGYELMVQRESPGEG